MNLKEFDKSVKSYPITKTSKTYSIKDGTGKVMSSLDYYDYSKKNFDWILIADDDAYLPENYISGLYEYIVTHDTDDVSVLCGLVEEHNSYDNMHRMILKKIPVNLIFLKNHQSYLIKNHFFT